MESTNAIVRKLRREIRQAPICSPGPDEYVDYCHWSKTGWAIWKTDGGCSCRPAAAPQNAEQRG
jgi:hypothetical protein